MALRRVRLEEVRPFDYEFGGSIKARMADIGRSVGSPDFHSFENTGTTDLVIWAFGNRFVHEVCLYPDEGLAFVEGLGADVPLASAVRSEWTEDRRKR